MLLKNNDIIKLIDLTSLNTTDTNDSIINLINKANLLSVPVAALCIYKEFLPLATKYLNNKDIKVATVINFPNGDNTLLSTLNELNFCLNNNANEIDLVMPYSQLLINNITFVENYLKNIRKNCNVTLKIILETGKLKTEKNIELASKICINSGADFIKTSTGKVKTNATLFAAKIMLNQIKLLNKQCGFKAAGGIKTPQQAKKYIKLAVNILQESYLNNKFRFGASSLLDNLTGNINNTNNY